jgi:two-component system aerobic respiration control sensor histidine kinase ArcB
MTYHIGSIFLSTIFILNALLATKQISNIFKEKEIDSLLLLQCTLSFFIQLGFLYYSSAKNETILAVSCLLSILAFGLIISLSLIYKFNFFYIKTEQIAFNEILNQLPEHIYWKNRDGVWLGCNSKNWEDFGLKSAKDYIGKTDHDLFTKEEADKIRQFDLAVIQSGQPKTLEENIPTTHGKYSLYLSHKVPLRNRHQQVVGIIGVSVDITDARKKEIERLEFLENIIALMPGHVYWVDRNNVYLGCNDNQAKSIGLSSRKDIVGKRNIDIPGFLIPAALDPINKQVMESGKTILLEEPAILADGTHAIFLSNKVPLFDNSGEIVGMVGISLDITEKKRTEKELLETQNKLEGMTLVSASIAHELRTPLASLNMGISTFKTIMPHLMQAYLLAKENKLAVYNISNNNLEMLEKELVSMHNEVRASLTFIDMLLLNLNPTIDESKIEIFSVDKCIEEALSRYPFSSGQKSLIRWSSDAQNDFKIKGQFLLVTHILFNLLKNALYHVTKAGKGDIHIWTERTSSYNKIYFKDTGTGIPQDLLPHIFNRFFSRTRHGAGVGLTFCDWVMKSVNGNIVCESIENEYTMFTLNFPVTV